MFDGAALVFPFPFGAALVFPFGVALVVPFGAALVVPFGFPKFGVSAVVSFGFEDAFGVCFGGIVCETFTADAVIVTVSSFGGGVFSSAYWAAA